MSGIEKMEKRYRFECFFSGLYREAELTDKMPFETGIGTTRNCPIRLPRESFFTDVELSISCDEKKNWKLECGEGIYITGDSGAKLRVLSLSHGTELCVHYEEGGAEFGRISFIRDFEAGNPDYSRSVELSGVNSLEIGGMPSCQIHVRDESMGQDYISLNRNKGVWTLTDHAFSYGISINGVRKKGSMPIYDHDFFSVAGHSFYLNGERLYLSDDPHILINGLTLYAHSDSVTRLDYPRHRTGTRLYYRPSEEPIEVKLPPEKSKMTGQSILITILPMLCMIGVTVLLRGMMGGGGSFILYSAVSMSVGVVTSIVTYFSRKNEVKKAEEHRVEVYSEYIRRMDAAIDAARKEEQELLERNTPGMKETLNTLWRFDDRLFERGEGDPDFLSVRLGSGSIPSNRIISIDKKDVFEEDELATYPERLAAKYALLPDAPVLINFREASTIGLVGDGKEVHEAIKGMLMDLSIRHSYKDLKLALICSEEEASEWSFIRLLRHICDEESGMRFIAWNKESVKPLTEYLYKLLAERSGEGQEETEKKEDRLFLPHYVVFITKTYDLMQHPLSKYFSGDAFFGVSFVFCGNDRMLLPNCKKLICIGDRDAEVFDTENAGIRQNFLPQTLSDRDAARAVQKLACVSVEEISLAAQLTKSITFYRLFGVYSAEDIDLGKRWAASRVDKSMAAPLGVDTAGDIMCLDLHERAHGPHGLVAGTTGSGKSETMQSFLLSLAITFHPYEVGFVIIDFKGGGMVNQFRDLPHLVGSITDIDGREIQRSLLSIRAELDKRKELFAAAGVNQIDNYIRKYKRGEAEVPLPHLILLVDEFAELKAEQPEFMKELISTARIGRSLGVHLILATQKPAGVVDAQIWSNSRFRLCLKVATNDDSKEMLKTPLAAEIREPGRAYLQVGNNEIFELFQTAYSGGSPDSEILSGEKAYEIRELALNGAGNTIFKQEKKRSSEDSDATQLSCVVQMISDYCEKQGIPRLPGICLPPLPDLMPYQGEERSEDTERFVISVGVYDDPEHQAQNPFAIDVTANHTMIIGSAMSGKTALIQQMIRSAAERYSPEDLNIYIVDFASKALGLFSELNHVAGVVFNDQEDRLKTLMKLLLKIIRDRKELFSSHGITSFSGYRQAKLGKLPQVLVFIDNFLALRELYPVYDDDLMYLLREGVSVGVSVVAASLQTGGMGFRYLSNFSAYAVFHCNDSSEYGNVFDRCRMEPKNVAGRAIVAIDKGYYEMQSYLAFEGEKEIDRAQSIREFVTDIRRIYGNVMAKRLPEIPEKMTEAWLRESITKRRMYELFFGMDYDEIETVSLQLSTNPLLAISGTEHSGMSNLMRLIAHSLEKNRATGKENAALWILDASDEKLKDIAELPIVKKYTSNAGEATKLLEEIYAEAKVRSVARKAGDMSWKQEAPELILICRESSFYTNSEKRHEDLFGALYKATKELKIAFILGNVENAMIGFSAGPILRTIRDARNLIFTDKLENLRLMDLVPGTLREFKNNVRMGDAFFIRGNEVKRVKIAEADKT